jgi:hypothetical protein
MYALVIKILLDSHLNQYLNKKIVHIKGIPLMAIDTPQDSKKDTPNLSLKEETLDFFFRVCGYTPTPAISQALADPNFGFLSEKYKVMD